MERMDDKLLRSKLDSLHGLPESYEPSLESKWELLEAGIHGKKKRPALAWWAAAAGIALLAALWMLIPSEKPAPAVAAKTNEAASNQNDSPAIVQEAVTAKNEAHSSAPVKPSQAANKREQPAPQPAKENQMIAANDTAIALPVNESALATEEPPSRIRKKKYIEIDFNEPAHEPKEEQQASAQPVKFRLLPSQHNEEPPAPSSLKLKRSF